MFGDLIYSLGTLAGTGLGLVESRLAPAEPGAASPESMDDPRPAGDDDRRRAADDDGGEGLLVDAVIAGTAAWVIKKSLRPRSVSWPRVVAAGIGATVLADAVGRVLGTGATDGERAYEDDPDALLVRLASGVAVAAGYAALLYPRLPGSALTKGLIFGAMDLAAAPHGGLVRVAAETPGLKFPLKDLAIPGEHDPGLPATLAFGLALGFLYRPDLDDA